MTQTQTYKLLHNQDSMFCRGYEPGDNLTPGYQGEIPVDPDAMGNPYFDCERIFARHNRDDRPDGQTAPSLSVGDVIVLGDTAFTVLSIGFEQVTL